MITHFVILLPKPNIYKNRNIYNKKSKGFKIYQNVSKIKGKIPETQEKTQNSRTKLKIREDFTPPERPSGVIKKA